MGNIRNPMFGVKKDLDSLTTQDPNSVLYVVTPDSKFIPARADALGRLELAAVTLDMSDIQIGAVEIKDHTTDDRVHITPIEFALRTEARLHDGAGTDLTSTVVGPAQALDVNFVGFGGGGILTEADDDDIPDSLTRPTNIVLGYGYDTANTRWERLNQTGGSLDVNITSPIPLEVNLDNTNDDVLIYGQDSGATNRTIRTNSIGQIETSVIASVLPIGAATETTLAALAVSAASIDTDFDVALSTRASEVTLAALNLKVVTVDTDDVTITSSVLPTGAATEATQATLLTEATFAAEDFATEATLATMLTLAGFNARINTLGQKASAASTPVVLASDQSTLDVNILSGAGGPEVTDAATLAGSLTAVRGVSLNYGWDGSTWERINSTSNRLLVDGSGVTQPISAASLPLPTGAATSALQITGNTSLGNIDTSLDVALSTIASEATVATLLTEATFTAEDFATEATLATMLTLAGFNARINTLGQKASAASTPVVIASNQSTISTDITDDTAREVGRVLASDNIYTNEIYVTTDTFLTARPSNGDFDLQHYKTKTIVVKNTHVSNNARINVFGSVDGGTNFDIILASNTLLNSGNSLIVSEERAVTHIKVEAKASVASNQATINTRAYALGV